MNKKEAPKSSRRSFLSIGLIGGAGLLARQASAMSSGLPDETVPMMTADGKLVEVNKNILEKSTTRQKADNTNILDWKETHTKPNT